MATLVDSSRGGRYLYVKGAPEIVLGKCTSFADKSAVEAQLTEYQNMAMRTLGVRFLFVVTMQKSCDEALAAGELTFIEWLPSLIRYVLMYRQQSMSA